MKTSLKEIRSKLKQNHKNNYSTKSSFVITELEKFPNNYQLEQYFFLSGFPVN